MMAAFTYLVECADGSYYAGWTTDLSVRLAAHNSGIGARYTRSRLPVRLVYWLEFADKQAAMRQEAAIKKMTRAQKKQMVESFKSSAKAATGQEE